MKKFITSIHNIFQHPNNKSKFIITLIRLIWWKTNQILLKMPAIIKLETNIYCLCYPDSSYGSQIVYTQYPEYYELMFTKNFLNNSSTFIDVGAGFGDYSLVAASKIKKGKIYSFEPILKEFNRFKINIQLNKLNNIIIPYNIAISNRKDIVNFTVNNISEYSKINIGNPNKNDIKIKSITLDHFTNENKITNIDLLKIDVEGLEYEVIKGAKRLLKDKKIKILIIEFNKNQQINKKNKFTLIEYLENLDYHIFEISKTGLKRIKKFRFFSTKNFIVIQNSKTLIKKANKIANALL